MSCVPWSNETERAEYYKNMFYAQMKACDRLQGLNEKLCEELYGTSAGNIVEVVRCQDCVHAVPLDRNCELSTSLYMHCGLWRGDETKNVWHKYKKYHKDYSLVYRDDFCSAGAKMDGKGEGE